MPDAPPINRPSVGRTFIVAISVLGVVACGQLALFGYAFVQRWKHPQAVVARTAEASVDPVIVPAPGGGDADESLSIEDPFEPDPGAANSSTGQLAAAKLVPADPSVPITPPPKPVPMRPVPFEPPPETRFQELLGHGRKLRERGDMTAALTRFREAQVLEFQSAEPIYEIAITLEQMRLNDRAAEMWRRIYDMGRDAGPFYVAAEARLKQSQAQALMAAKATQGADGGPVSSTKPDAMMGLGQITSEDARISDSAKKFTLQVPLRARPNQEINVQDVTIKVLFYDLVDGKNVVQTSANVSSRFGSSPVDWSGNETEILEVDYDLPMPPPTIREDRKYFGYIVRLYYKGELQDTRAEPAVLNAKFPAPATLDSEPAQ